MDATDELKRWFQDHHHDLYHFLCKISGDPVLSQDIVQEACARAFIKLHLFDRSRGTLKNWLYRLALNLWHDELRARRRETHAATQAASDPTRALPAGAPAESEVEDERARMRQAFAMLPVEKRELLVLAASNPVAEVAAILDIPEGTVKSRVFHARRELMAILGRLQKENER